MRNTSKLVQAKEAFLKIWNHPKRKAFPNTVWRFIQTFFKSIYNVSSRFLGWLILQIKWYWNLSLKKKLKVSALSILSSFVLGIVGLIIFFYAIYNGAFGHLPTTAELSQIKNYEASEIYSSDNVLIGRYFVENRSDSPYEEISPFLIQALIATEDSRFYEHTGVDHMSLMRVLFKSIILGQNTGGGSTLSQQLIKNLFGRENHGILTMPIIKIREGILANRLEEIYSKEEILILYLNTVSFGENTFGIKTACERFFSTSPKDIKPQDAATLIGMLKGPSLYNPRTRPDNALNRRNVVLGQMLKNGFIDDDTNNGLKSSPLVLQYNRGIEQKDLAPFYKEYVRKELEQILETMKKPDGSSYNLLTDGLKITVTLDSKLQEYAEKAVDRHLSKLQKELYIDLKNTQLTPKKGYLVKLIKNTNSYKKEIEAGKSASQAWKAMERKKTRSIPYRGEWVDSSVSVIDSVLACSAQLQTGFLVTDPHSGQIKAWVGGKSFSQSQYDHVTAGRQVGSIFKPIVYAKALVDGKDPCDYISNKRVEYTQYNNWSPKNSDGFYEGRYSLLGALTNSVNTITVKLCMEIGIDSLIQFAQKLGIESPLSPSPSVALGVDNLALLNILGVYTSFANQGIQHKINTIIKIDNAQGKTLYTHQKQEKKTLSTSITQDITNMLQNVVNNGTAQRMRSIYNIHDAIAGKTGTTQNQTDGWFVGYTPTLLAGAWVGCDDPSVHFSNTRQGQGANMSLPIWANFYQSLEKDPYYSKKYLHKEFPFENNLDCEEFLEDRGLRKLFTKKGVKTSDETGFEEKPHWSTSNTPSDKKGKKKKKFGLFKNR